MITKARNKVLGAAVLQEQQADLPPASSVDPKIVLLCKLYQKHVESVLRYLQRVTSWSSEMVKTHAVRAQFQKEHLVELVCQHEFGEDWRSTEEQVDLALRALAVRLQQKLPSAADKFPKDGNEFCFGDLSDPVLLDGLLRYAFVTSENKWCDLWTGTLMVPQALSTKYAHKIENLPGRIKLAAGKIIADARGWWPGKAEVYSYKGQRFVNTYRPSDLVQHRCPGPVEFWLEHLERLIPNEAQREYVLNWMAYALQNPGRKLNHQLLIGGDSGIGKDSLFQPFLRGVGACSEVGERAIASDFEDHLYETKLVSVQEISSFLGSQDFEDRLKPQLANPPETLLINPKSRGKKEVPNLMNWIFYTNRPYPLNLSANDRRMYCIWCAPSQADAIKWSNEAYFERYYDQMNSGGDYSVVDWLLARDVSSFNPAGHPPMTPWKRDIIRQSGGDVLVCLRELMETNSGPFQLPLIRTDDVKRMVPELKDKSDAAISSALKELGCKKPEQRVAKKINGKSVELNVYCTSQSEALNAKNGAELFDLYWQERLKVLPPPDGAIVPDGYRSAFEKLQDRSHQER